MYVFIYRTYTDCNNANSISIVQKVEGFYSNVNCIHYTVHKQRC